MQKKIEEMSVQEIIDGCKPTTEVHEVLVAQRGRSAIARPASGNMGACGTIKTIWKDADQWRVTFNEPFAFSSGTYPASEVFLDAAKPTPDEVYDSMRAEPAVRWMPDCRWELVDGVWRGHMLGYDVRAKQYGPDDWRAYLGDVRVPVEEVVGESFEIVHAVLREVLRRRNAEYAIVPPAPTAGQMPVAIAQALFVAQTKIKSVTKTSENEGDGYSYASADAITRESRVLHEAGLCIVPVKWKAIRDVFGEPSLQLWFRLVHKDGVQWDAEPVEMPIVLDSGKERRAPDKALATALTYGTSQWTRLMLQIDRTDPSADADARIDRGDGGRRRKSQDTPLSTELNDVVIALHEAIDSAKSNRALNGAAQRLEQVKKDLPAKVVERIQEKLMAKQAAMPAEAAKPEGSGT